ncbi:MAG: Rrf2 family transcriptional regulator [Elusimicrobiota bacterium]|nr:Rrf2 family transcriptional regulator [Elusimicrobiota bacterium]
MKLITKETDYAVRALANLAKDGALLKNAKLISIKEKIPYPFLRKILRKFKEKKYIETKKGINGGIRLIKNPKKINITDVIELFQGRIELSSCMFRKKLCANRKTCVLRKKIMDIEDTVIQKFKNITIHDLVREGRPG